MSDLTRITQILEDAIANRQKLAIGQSIAAIVSGQTGLFLAGDKTISAIATNYCYGNCLLAKVEGKWYAINPDDNRRVVSGGVDRLFHRKPKFEETEPRIIVINELRLGISHLSISFGDRNFIWFASNTFLESATNAEIFDLQLSSNSRQLNPSAVDTDGYLVYQYSYPPYYPYPLPVRNYQSYAEGGRPAISSLITEIDTVAIKTAINQFNPEQYRYLYYGTTARPSSLQYRNIASIPIGLNEVGYSPPGATTTDSVKSLAISENAINFTSPYWLLADFFRSYHRDPLIKLGIRNSVANNRISTIMTASAELVLNNVSSSSNAVLGATTMYHRELFGHSVVVVDLEKIELSRFVSNKPSSYPYANRFFPHQVLASSFAPDLVIDENQDVYQQLHTGSTFVYQT